MSKKEAKILVFDIETASLVVDAWDLWDQNIGLNQIIHDWSVLSWAAKWLDKKTIMYMDVSKQTNLRDDKAVLEGIWKLLDEADIVITQNGKAFDVKKLNARFIINGMPPPSNFEHIDTLRLAKKYFKFTSNKLEYMAKALNVEHKKLTNRKFIGHSLWTECLKGNPEAWKEMKRYNILDILALEGVYRKLVVYDGDATTNFNKYREVSPEESYICKCGAENSRMKYGFRWTKVGKYQRYKCSNCGAESFGKDNLLSKKHTEKK